MNINQSGNSADKGRVAPQFMLIGLLNRFDNRYQSAADAFFKELSWKQIFFLNGVTLFRQAPTIKDMADFMGCSHQNANKLYARLMKDGYISSRHDRHDHRKQRLYLTDKAREFLANTKADADKSVADIFSVVSNEEIETVINIMKRLTDRLEEMHE